MIYDLTYINDPTSPKVDQSYVDTEGDILLLEAFLNNDPSLPPPNQGNYLPEVRKELKICEAKTDKSSINEPSEVELKDLPPHLKLFYGSAWQYIKDRPTAVSHDVIRQLRLGTVFILSNSPHGTGGSDDGVTTSLSLSRNSRPPMLDHQDKYMMKAQVHVSKSSTISDIQALSRRKHYCQIYQVVKHKLRGRLLAKLSRSRA
nr:hypothetical protein [Tanacetum cinerariifolium]